MSVLIYNTPARNWNGALPIGNGRLGGMVFGDPYDDRIQINEDTLWSGRPNRDTHAFKHEELQRVRELLSERDYAGADRAVRDMMPGTDSSGYCTLGSISFELKEDGCEAPKDFVRALDLDTAIYASRYTFPKNDPFVYTKEYFTSFADDVMVFHFTCNIAYNELYIHMNPYLKSQTTFDGDTVTVRGTCPTDIKRGGIVEYDENGEAIEFVAKLKLVTDSPVHSHGNFAYTSHFSDFYAILSVGTSFNGFDKMPRSEGKDAEAECDRRLNAALKYTYEELKARHIAAYQKEYSTCRIELDGKDRDNLTTDTRIQAIVKSRNDPKLIQTLFEYGRYLLLCSSREGTQAANLQGIWSKDVSAPWRSNYTTNINVQMNYWACEQVGLSHCHMPMLQLLRDVSTRPNHLGLSGWYCAHNTDIWRYNQESTKAPHGFWQMGGVWMARHIYEHFAFTQDMVFLRENFDILEGCDAFLRDLMVEDEEGYLTTSPSESPENVFIFDGTPCQISTGTGMDLSLIGDFYKYMAELSEVLGRDADEYRAICKRIKPLGIGSDGRLLEWNEEFTEREAGHRHISHLVGYFPCNAYGEDSPYYDAMRKSLDFRLANGGGGTGWSNAWIVNMLVRMKESETAYDYVIRMFEKSMYDNMLDAHPPFQIDGNFGVCCGIVEMLVQSHRGKIELLPSLPSALANGSAEGICARGGYRINMSWKRGKIDKLEIFDTHGTECSKELIDSGKVTMP